MKSAALIITFLLGVTHAFAQHDELTEDQLRSQKSELDKSLDLQLEKNLKTHFNELGTVHSQVTAKSSMNSASMQANPLPSQAEYDALLALYQSTGGANWVNNSGWSTANPNSIQYVGNWHGVITDANGHVTYLLLNDNNLVGQVPPSLENLSSLFWLNLRSNSLNGDLEDWLGVFPSLAVLHLANNSFTGPIPQDLGLNTSLTDIYFNRNQLSGTIPSNIGNLTNLKWLVLYDNDLTGSIPSELGNLQNLEYLYLYRNDLSGTIPGTVGNMLSLKFLGLHTNSFTGQVPASIGNLTNLTSIFLQNNHLEGPLPTTLGNLSILQNLWLYGNDFSGSIPASFGSLTNVHTFHAFDNQLSGSIPTQLGGMTSLKFFRLNLNQLTGSIPAQLGNLVNLEDMRLSNNQLTGTIPSSLCSLSSLTVFHTQMNELTGDIPLCLLTNGPTEVMLSHNYYYFTDLVNKTQYFSQQSFYSPQRTDPALTNYILDGNGSIALTTIVGKNLTNPSSYQWFKNDNVLTGASFANDSVTVACPSSGNGISNCAGRYVAEVTNTGYPTIVLLAEGEEVKNTNLLKVTICSSYRGYSNGYTQFDAVNYPTVWLEPTVDNLIGVKTFPGKSIEGKREPPNIGWIKFYSGSISGRTMHDVSKYAQEKSSMNAVTMHLSARERATV